MDDKERRPNHYALMAKLGLLSNSLALLGGIAAIVATTFNLAGTEEANSELSLNALSYAFEIAKIPLYLLGIRICNCLLSGKEKTVNRIRFYFISYIMLEIALTAGEAKFNLDAGSSSSIEVAVSMFGIVVSALILNYWDGEKMKNYWSSLDDKSSRNP